MKFLKFLFVLFFPITSLAQPKLVTLTAHDLPHYSEYKNSEFQPIIANDTFNGEAVAVVRCVFEALEQPLRIRVLPWKRAQYEVKNGVSDGFFGCISQRC